MRPAITPWRFCATPGGANLNLEGAWAYPPPLFRTSLQIAGSHGLIDHPVDSAVPVRVTAMQQSAETPEYCRAPPTPLAEPPYTTQLKEFYARWRHGATPRVTAHDGLMALKLAFAAIRSAETGRPVRPQRFERTMTLRLGIMSFAHLHAEVISAICGQPGNRADRDRRRQP